MKTCILWSESLGKGRFESVCLEPRSVSRSGFPDNEDAEKETNKCSDDTCNRLEFSHL